MSNRDSKARTRQTTTKVVKETTQSPPTPSKRRRRRRTGPRGRGGKVSPYLASLLYPPLMNVKIPDRTCIPTSCATITHDDTLTINGNGCTGVMVYCRSFGGTVAYQKEASTSQDGTFVYDSAVFPTGSASFDTSFGVSRLVSASVEVEFLGASLNDGGRIHLMSAYATRTHSEANPTSTGTMLSARDNMSSRITSGGFIRWKPLDDNADTFQGATTPVELGKLFVHISGATVGAPFRLRIVWNFEAIPKTDTLSYTDAQPSPVDLSSFNAARDVMASTSSFETYTNIAHTLSQGAALVLSAKSFGHMASRLAGDQSYRGRGIRLGDQ